MSTLRKELPELPDRMKKLPVDARGYPVPWFVVWLDEDGKQAARGEGKPEFRVMDEQALHDAIMLQRCWVCGEKLGSYKVFTIGPMCTVNRATAEPPSHLTCAEFSVKGCPFLSRPRSRRNHSNMPEEAISPVGVSVERNPGVTALWTTKAYTVRATPRLDPDGNITGAGIMLGLGDPLNVDWFFEGRKATRAEVAEAIESGTPALRDYADGPIAHQTLDRLIAKAMRLLP